MMSHTFLFVLSTHSKPTNLFAKRIAILVTYSMSGFFITKSIKISVLEMNTSDTQYALRLDVDGLSSRTATSSGVSDIPTYFEKAHWILRLYTLYGEVTLVNSTTLNESLYMPTDSFSFNFNLTRITQNESIVNIKNKMAESNIFTSRRVPHYLLHECQIFLIDCGLANESLDSTIIVQNVKCINIGQPYEEASNLAKTILTYSGMVTSVVGLIVSIRVHRKAVMHKSVPGSNVENISVSLLTTNVMFMIGIGANDEQTVCYVVGVILHYLWMVVFSFKTIALLYITHNLVQMMVKDSNPLLQRTGFFTALGLSLPMLFLIPSVIIDFYGPIDLEYNGRVCFPTGYPANILFVSIPIGLSVIINISCFLTVAFVITKQSFETRNLRKSSSLEFVPVFSRISVVTGFFWITGLIGAVYASDVSEYFFIIFCSFQGLFVTIANLSTKTLSRNLRNSSGKTKETK